MKDNPDTDGQTADKEYESRTTSPVKSDLQTALGLSVIVRGIPRPQPRPRFAKGRVISTADANARIWIASVERAAASAIVCVGGRASLADLYAHAPALSVEMQFRFPCNRGRLGNKNPRPHGTPMVSKPDTDNLIKLVLDALVRKGALDGDDSRVSSVYAEKIYADPDDAGVTIVIHGQDGRTALREWPSKASDGSSLGLTPPHWVE